jgi:hypothetical protein
VSQVTVLIQEFKTELVLTEPVTSSVLIKEVLEGSSTEIVLSVIGNPQVIVTENKTELSLGNSGPQGTPGVPGVPGESVVGPAGLSVSEERSIDVTRTTIEQQTLYHSLRRESQ